MHKLVSGRERYNAKVKEEVLSLKDEVLAASKRKVSLRKTTPMPTLIIMKKDLVVDASSLSMCSNNELHKENKSQATTIGKLTKELLAIKHQLKSKDHQLKNKDEEIIDTSNNIHSTQSIADKHKSASCKERTDRFHHTNIVKDKKS